MSDVQTTGHASGAPGSADTTGDERERARRRVPAILLLLLIAFVVLWLILSRLAPVPDVIGLTPEQAKGVLADAGFVLGETGEASSEDAGAVNVGEIATQAPLGGTRAFKGSGVDVFVAVGAGDDGTAAGDAEVFGRWPSEDGSVTAPGKDPDTEALGEYWSSAPADTRPLVPMVQNKTEAAAATTVRAAGYRVVLKYGPASAGVRKGHVYAQIPAPDTRLERGATVTLWVSTGVPPVNGLPQPGPGR